MIFDLFMYLVWEYIISKLQPFCSQYIHFQFEQLKKKEEPSLLRQQMQNLHLVAV